MLAVAASAWTCWIRAFLSSVEEGSEAGEVDEGEEPKKDILCCRVCGYERGGKWLKVVCVDFLMRA